MREKNAGPATDAAQTRKPRARNWREVRAEAVDRGLLTEAGITAATKRQDEHIKAWRLRQLREDRLMTQETVAKVMNVDQSRVSRLENGDISRSELATLRTYIEALGGQLRVVAVFGDEQLTLG